MNLPVPPQVLKCYPVRFRPVRGEAFEQRQGFSGARVFRVETPSGTFALRGWPTPSLPVERLRGLHRLLAHVFEFGVTQVPVPRTDSNGKTLVSAEGRYWQLEPWMPGKADFHTRPNDARLVAVMQCLAHFHQASLTFDAAMTSSLKSPWFSVHDCSPSPAVIERLERIRRCLAFDCRRLHIELARAESDALSTTAVEFLSLFEQTAPHVAELLSAAADMRFRLQPCLRDIWHDHVLFTGNEVTGLIDASACRMDHVAVDLSRLLGSLLGEDRSRWDMALAAYAGPRGLQPDELRLIEILDRSGILLSGMTWLQRCYLQRASYQQPQRVLARLQHFLSRLRDLHRQAE